MSCNEDCIARKRSAAVFPDTAKAVGPVCGAVGSLAMFKGTAKHDDEFQFHIIAKLIQFGPITIDNCG